MAVNDYNRPYTINRDTYIDNLDASIEAMITRPTQADEEMDEFFFPIKADSMSFKMSSVGNVLDLPKENEDEDALPASAPAHGRETTFNLVTYRQKVQIDRTFMNADRFGKGNLMASGMPNALTRKKQYLMNVLFTNAFTSGTGSDGAYLIADSHDPVNPEGTARDNNGSGALSVDNWHVLRLLAADQVDELGYPMPGVLNKLFVPTALERTAKEIMTAKLDPETALNTPMVLADAAIKVGHYLSSSTAYFATNDKIDPMSRGMYFVYMVKGPDIQDCRPSSNPDVVWAKRSYFQGTYGFSEATEYLYGAAGT